MFVHLIHSPDQPHGRLPGGPRGRCPGGPHDRLPTRPSDRLPGLLRLILAGLLLTAGLGLAACQGGQGPEAKKEGTATATADARAATPTVNASVDRVVTADGVLMLPADPQPLSFSGSGRVAAVMVTEGQRVKQGEALAKLEVAPLAANVLDARSNLAQAEAALAKLQTGTERETSRLEVERAKNTRWGQQAQRDATCGQAERKLVPQVACDQAQAAVQAAEQGVQIAEQGLQNYDKTADSSLAAARARVDASRAALQQAQSNQTNATLTAPFTGTITAVKITAGVLTAAGAPAVTLAQTEPLRFATTNLSERNVGDVHVGSPAQITLTAYPERHLDGTVQRIADQAGEDASGTVVFTVYVDLAPTDLPVRAGMTGRVEIGVAGGG